MKRLERLTYTDLTNLAVDGPDTQMHQGALGVLDGAALLDADGHVRADRVREHVAARLDRVPLLRRRLWKTAPFLGRPLWVDDAEFAIEHHVLVARLPEPGGERRAIEFAQQHMAELMDRSRPLWELWLLEGFGPGLVGVFLKLHHAMADGGAILNIVALLFDTEPNVVETQPAPWTPQAPPGAGALLLDNLVSKADTIASGLRRLGHPVVLCRAAAANWRRLLEATRQGRHAAVTSLNARIGSQRRIGVLPLDLAEVKAAAHARGAKVNDVLLDVIASGLRAVLLERGESTRGIAIHASMAVRLPEADGALGGNHAGTMVVPLPLEQDEVPRLGSIARATAEAKQRQSASVPQGLMVLLAVTGLTRFFIRRQHMVNILVTNLAGPPFPLYIAGAKILDVFAITPVAGNVTASFAALSYDGRIDLAVDADASSWPDLDVLISAMARGWLRLSGSKLAA